MQDLRRGSAPIFLSGFLQREVKKARFGRQQNEGHGRCRAPVGRVYPHRHAGSTLRSSPDEWLSRRAGANAGGVEVGETYHRNTDAVPRRREFLTPLCRDPPKVVKL